MSHALVWNFVRPRNLAPLDLSGWKLYPLIVYCRNQLAELRAQGKFVLTKHVPSSMNPADTLAYHAMQEGRGMGWPRQQRVPLIDEVPGLRESMEKVEYLTKELVSGRLTLATEDGQTIRSNLRCS